MPSSVDRSAAGMPCSTTASGLNQKAPPRRNRGAREQTALRSVRPGGPLAALPGAQPYSMARTCAPSAGRLYGAQCVSRLASAAKQGTTRPRRAAATDRGLPVHCAVRFGSVHPFWRGTMPAGEQDRSLAARGDVRAAALPYPATMPLVESGRANRLPALPAGRHARRAAERGLAEGR